MAWTAVHGAEVERLGQLRGHQPADLVQGIRVGPAPRRDLDAVPVGQGLELGIDIGHLAVVHFN